MFCLMYYNKLASIGLEEDSIFSSASSSKALRTPSSDSLWTLINFFCLNTAHWVCAMCSLKRADLQCGKGKDQCLVCCTLVHKNIAITCAIADELSCLRIGSAGGGWKCLTWWFSFHMATFTFVQKLLTILQLDNAASSLRTHPSQKGKGKKHVQKSSFSVLLKMHSLAPALKTVSPKRAKLGKC